MRANNHSFIGYGIDTANQDQLIAANMTNEEMCEFIGCDSLEFISLDGLREAVGDAETRGEGGSRRAAEQQAAAAMLARLESAKG